VKTWELELGFDGDKREASGSRDYSFIHCNAYGGGTARSEKYHSRIRLDPYTAITQWGQPVQME
jgi:hypothetical protein